MHKKTFSRDWLGFVTGAKLRVAQVDDSGKVLLGEYQKLLNSRTKPVSFMRVSNALGTVTPTQEIIAMARRVLLDVAQPVSHLQVVVQWLDCDWCVFSGHKKISAQPILVRCVARRR